MTVIDLPLVNFVIIPSHYIKSPYLKISISPTTNSLLLISLFVTPFLRTIHFFTKCLFLSFISF